MVTAVHFLQILFSAKPTNEFFGWASYTNINVAVAIIAAILFMGPLQEKYGYKYSELRKTNAGLVIDAIFIMLVLFVSIGLIINGSYSPSIYAGF